MTRTPILLLALLLAACAARPIASPSVAVESDVPGPSVTDSDSPSPSPAGGAAELDGQLAFVAGAEAQIHLLDLSTGEVSQLTNLGPEDAELTAEGRLRPVVTCGFGPTGLAWSPDGSQLAFAYGGCETVLYVVDVDGTLTRIADGYGPAWSPDGTRLVFRPNTPFCLTPDCGEPPHPGAWSLQVVDLAGGGEPEPLSLEPAAELAGQPAFSHDGSLIAFTGPLPAGESDPDMSGAAYVMRSDGSEPRLVARGVWSPGWLADGRMLVVEERTGDLHAIDLETDNGTRIGSGAGPASASPDGTRLLLTSSDPVSGASTTRMTTLEGVILAELAGFPAAWDPDSGAAVILHSTDTEAAFVFVGRDGESLGRFSPPDLMNGGLAAWRPPR